MNRLVCFFALLACCAGCLAQTWEKLVTPGLTYRMEVDLALPRVVHAFRYTPGAGSVSSTPALANGKVFDTEPEGKGTEVLSETLKRTGALAGMNADFFPFTGDPVGTMVVDGELVSTPWPNRAMFAWGKQYFALGALTFGAWASSGGVDLQIDAVNAACNKDQLVLNTPLAGSATATEASVSLVLEFTGRMAPSCTVTAKAMHFVADTRRLAVPVGQLVLTATGTKAAELAKIAQGADVRLTVETNGVDWKKAVHAVGGGPMLLTEGKVTVNPTAEAFSNDFSTAMHPRSAVGVTKSGDVWMVVVEGRQALSRGAALTELANILKRLGCWSALNMDGGGSTTLALQGMLVNRPSGGTERPIANSLLLFGPPLAAEPAGDFVKISVTDQGRGIPKDKLETVFERFSQVDATDEHVHKGIGLGLAISKAIVERHKGTIGVESVEGKGSTFWFTIPATESVYQSIELESKSAS